MLCFIALPIFLILGIFSVSYRKLAWEAIDCTFRRVTFRKCYSGLDERIKARITGKLIGRFPKLAMSIYKYFEVIAWIFLILMLVSGFYTVQGGYNYIKYGNCNGPNSDQFCIFNPLGTLNNGNVSEGEKCSTTGEKKDLILPEESNGPFLGSANASVKITEFGCYACPYTKESEDTAVKIREYYGDKIKFSYRNFFLDNHPNSRESAEASECADEQGKFWEYHELLFENQDEWKETGYASFVEYATELGLNTEQFSSCYISGKYKSEVEKDYQAGIKSNIYATPTFFINNQTIVGDVSFKDFKKIVESEMK